MRVARLLLALLFAVPAGAQPALDSLVPPSPAPNGFVADGGPVLDAAALARVNERIAAVQRRTGGDVGVAILRDLRDRAPSDVGVAIYRAWRVGRVDSIGSARRNLGALLLIVPKELAPSKRGECFITTGIGAEGTLIDARAGDICRDSIIPHLRERRYEPAIVAGVEGIGAAFDETTAGLSAPNEVGAATDRRTRSPAGRYVVFAGLGVLGAGGVTAGAVLAVRRRRRLRPRLCPNGHGPMTRLAEADDDAALTHGQAVEERLGSVDYDVWACGQCDARIVIPYKRSSPYEGCPKCGHRTVRRQRRTVRSATQLSTGLEQITLECENCGWRDETLRTTPQLPTPAVSSSSGGSWGGGGGGGGGGGRGSSFGGSGATAGGGGGSSY